MKIKKPLIEATYTKNGEKKKLRIFELIFEIIYLVFMFTLLGYLTINAIGAILVLFLVDLTPMLTFQALLSIGIAVLLHWLNFKHKFCWIKMKRNKKSE